MKNFFLSLSNENKGFIFGFVGIIIFSITPVATKIALGYNNSQLSAEFITFGRSALAGNLALLYLFFFRKKIPKLKYLFNFSIIAFCLSVVFPLTLSFGLIYSTSIHAGVILAFLPLATAIFASFYFKQKASKKTTEKLVYTVEKNAVVLSWENWDLIYDEKNKMIIVKVFDNHFKEKIKEISFINDVKTVEMMLRLFDAKWSD